MNLKTIFLKLSLCFVLFIGVPVITGQAHAAPAPDSFADLAEGLLPAVVNISSTQKVDNPVDFPEFPQFPQGSPFEDFFEEFMDQRGHGMPAVPPASLGSGFIIDAEQGLIVTNNHVIRDADEVRVTLHDDETLVAEVLGRDEKTDLAILKVTTNKKLTALEFGDSSVLRVGDWVLAIGNPFGLGGTVTAGIVSARQRDIQAGPYDDFIQTDASINRGNSGGPMFDLNGKVIGINTAIFSPSGGSVGIGFAIPSALAKPVIDQIIKYGRTRRGWIGVRIQSVSDEIAESLGLVDARGALVASMTKDGPAEKAGLQAGDVILEFNGKPVGQMRELPRIVAESDIDTKVDIVYWRDGKERKGRVSIGELEKAEEEGLLQSGPREVSDSIEVEKLGLRVRPLNETLRQDYAVPADIDGVLVAGIKPGSEAFNKGLVEGDIIVEVNQQNIESPSGLIEIIEKARKSGRSSVLLLVNREGDVRFVALKLQ